MINEKHICLYYGKQVFGQSQPRVSGGSSAIFVSNRTKVPFWFFLTKFWHMVRGCRTRAWLLGGWQQVTCLHHSSIIPLSSHMDLAVAENAITEYISGLKWAQPPPDLGKENKTMICRASDALSPNRPRVKSALGEESLLFTYELWCMWFSVLG